MAMNETGPIVIGGRMDGAVHRLPIRVYYEDTDAGGLVFHANYLCYVERGRTEMLRLLGSQHTDIEKSAGVAFAVRRCEIDYRAPARLDDMLEVQTRITDIRGASIEFEQTVVRPEPGGTRQLVRILLTVFCINPQGRPVRLPEPVRAALDKLRAHDANFQGRD